MLDQNGRLPQSVLTAGYDRYSAYDLSWQSLHMAAAVACRGSTPTGGSGGWTNVVLSRDPLAYESCKQICFNSEFRACDAEVSIYGIDGKATEHGQRVAGFYNFGCDLKAPGESEPLSADEDIMGERSERALSYSYCCCRKERHCPRQDRSSNVRVDSSGEKPRHEG